MLHNLIAMDKLKFIVPDWDDLVDPGYDFINERHWENYKKNKYVYGARIWHLFKSRLPIDGVLISRPAVESKIKHIKSAGGVRGFFRILPELSRDKFQVIADCGAWQYRTQDKPPYEPIETLNFYEELGVDYGVSVDHIAFFGKMAERIELTYRNAVRSFETWKIGYERGEYSFILLAAVQGLEVRDYIKYMRKLYERGVRHFALGGLGPRTSQFLDQLVQAIVDAFKGAEGIEKIHILGVARPSLIDMYRRLTEVAEEVSFDNATYLRAAWMRARGNYITLDGRAYTAIRVRRGSQGEREVLEALRSYAGGSITFERVMDTLIKYASKNGESEYVPLYAATLRDRPWESCPCPICKSTGIEVVIFGGNDRNRRRGFHNIYVFYSLLKQGASAFRFTLQKLDSYDFKDESNDALVEVLKSRGINANVRKILIVAHCTAEKEVDEEQVRRVLYKMNLPSPSFDFEREDEYLKVLSKFAKPAEEMYGGSFRTIRNLVEMLRECGKSVDLYIISARYGLIPGNRVIIPYEASLKGLAREELVKWAEQRSINRELTRILYRNYDCVIVVLPREYYLAAREAFEPLLLRRNVIMIVPSSPIAKRQHIKALTLPGSTISRRLKSLKALREALMISLGCSQITGILKFLNHRDLHS